MRRYTVFIDTKRIENIAKLCLFMASMRKIMS